MSGTIEMTTQATEKRSRGSVRGLLGDERHLRWTIQILVIGLYGYGLLAHVDGDWDRARRHYAVAVDGFIDLGTPVWEGIALAGLGRCDEADGDTAAAIARYAEALELGRRLGEPAVTACALEGLARLALAAGDRATATTRSVEAAGIREQFQRPAPPHELDDLRPLVEAS